MQIKKRVANLLKYNRIIYSFYYYSMGGLINFIKLFIKTDDKLILFNSYAGRKYDDSPKEIFERIQKDRRFIDYKFVWAFHDPYKFKVEDATIIRTDGIKYFLTALKARVWITNSSVERGLSFKNKETLYINTWHGSPIKTMGSDIVENNSSFKSKAKNNIDYMNAQSRFEADIFSSCFGILRDHFLEVGLPRNDILSCYSEEMRETIRNKLSIPSNKTVILYCPTFREFEKDEGLGVVMAPPMNLTIWEKELGNRFVLLFRAHYEVSKALEIKDSDFARNMTDYPSLNELMIASDVLISDYSSIFFDYSIMDKPMIHFTYDYDEYKSKRGMYFDIREYIDGSDNESDIITMLKNMDYDDISKTKKFRDTYVEYYGQATEKTVDFIARQLQ